MASVVKSAKKPASARRDSDVLRIQAGRMLTFDELVAKDDIAERKVFRRVIRQGIQKSMGLLQLPLSLAVFMAYVGSGYWHEDPTNEFLVESRLRMRTDEIFGEVATIDEWWDAVLDTSDQGLSGFLFRQTDNYGGDLSRSNDDDPLYGNAARVDSFNQLQAYVRFETTRPRTASFGTTPYNCSSDFECSICRDTKDNGFFEFESVRNGIDENLTVAACSSDDRRLEGDVLNKARRLRLGDMTLREFLPQSAAASDDTFVFNIYPAEPLDKILTRIRYYRDREWLDADTQTVKLSMYFLNSELGRPRLEQLTINFYFSASGELIYERALRPIFLKFWPPGFAGLTTMMFDGSFVFLLLLNTGWRLFRVWISFVKSHMADHVSQPATLFELLNILIGWYCFMNLWSLRNESALVVDTLSEVRFFGLQYPPTPEMLQASDAFYDQAESSAKRFESVAFYWPWYTFLLQFRFFINFGAQPRLALVTNTIRAVVVDLVHFLIVLLPTFLTYAFAGNLLFGRRMREFSTLFQSLMTCFRIMIESEYPWDDLAAKDYITAGIWSWTFISLVSILMINMVLAIILDVYNEVHDNSAGSETIWETCRQVYNRFYHLRTWVSYSQLKTKTDQNLPPAQCFIEKDDIRAIFPNIPDIELTTLFKNCRRDMGYASCDNLDKSNLVKLSGAIMSTADKANHIVKKVNFEGDPLNSWVEPTVGKVADALQDLGNNFLTMPVHAKGHRDLKLLSLLEEQNGNGNASVAAQNGKTPEWYSEVQSMLEQQQKWLDHATWQTQQMQWEVQVAHVERSGGQGPLPAEGGVL